MTTTIADELNRIKSAKTSIRAAIQAKGVTVPSNVLISTYANYISQISTGSGGESVPRLPDRLVVSKDMKSKYDPAYIGTYVKQGTPADWTDTYYCKPSIEQYGTSYYICCVVGEGSGGEAEYSWIITTTSPENQTGENVITGKLINSVISEVPVAPQDIRWEVDTGGNDQTFIIVEEDGNSGGGGGSSPGDGYPTSITISNCETPDVNGTYTWTSQRTEPGKPIYSNSQYIMAPDTDNYWYIAADTAANREQLVMSGMDAMFMDMTADYFSTANVVPTTANVTWYMSGKGGPPANSGMIVTAQ